MTNAITVNYDEWREDFVSPESGTVVKDVLWIRATSGDLSYLMPVFPPDGEQDVKDAKALLFIKISVEKGVV